MPPITPQSAAQALDALVRAQLAEVEQLARSGRPSPGATVIAQLVEQIAANIEALTGSQIVPLPTNDAGNYAIMAFAAAVRALLDTPPDEEFPF